jgi:predicted TIM-barrel fold metal-dependent hydrolase
VGYLASFVEEYGAGTLNYEAQVCSLVFCGVFDRFPSLRVVLAESGWTWLPSLMWRMDKEWKSAQREVPWVDGPPSGYVRRHLRATTQPTDAPPQPEQLRVLLDELGTEMMLMYASDYPHRYPVVADELLSMLSAEEARRLLWANAAECYALPRTGVTDAGPERRVAPEADRIGCRWSVAASGERGEISR